MEHCSPLHSHRANETTHAIAKNSYRTRSKFIHLHLFSTCSAITRTTFPCREYPFVVECARHLAHHISFYLSLYLYLCLSLLYRFSLPIALSVYRLSLYRSLSIYALLHLTLLYALSFCHATNHQANQPQIALHRTKRTNKTTKRMK